jgi:drug/metabolite transporter (DMT)-like permease
VPYAGELAALVTAFCWVGSTLFFDAAGRRVGSLSLNLARLVLGSALLAVYGALAHGAVFPWKASPASWLWLSLSGLVGFTFGDMCLFRAYLVVGPRLAALLMALAPPIAALLGWAVLGERLTAGDVLGMGITLAGIGWVVLERPDDRQRLERGQLWKGVLLGLGGALGQGGGLVLSKLGMGDLDPFAATQIRALAGMLGFAAVFVVLGWWRRFFQSLRDARAMGLATLGAFFGPFLGVSLSLYSIQHAQVGVAATIMALVPVLILPVLVVVRGERVSWRAAAGAVVAVAGVAVLFA